MTPIQTMRVALIAASLALMLTLTAGHQRADEQAGLARIGDVTVQVERPAMPARAPSTLALMGCACVGLKTSRRLTRSK